MSKTDLTDDPSQHQPTPLEQARESAGVEPTERELGAKREAIAALVAQAQGHLEAVCDVIQREGGDMASLHVAKDSLRQAFTFLGRSIEGL